MLLAVQSEDSLHKIPLPHQISGAHWIEDAHGTRIASVEEDNGRWLLRPRPRIRIISRDGSQRDSLEIRSGESSIIALCSAEGDSWSLIAYPEDPGSLQTQTYGFSGDFLLTIGRKPDNTLVYANSLVSGHHAQLVFQLGEWFVTDNGSANGVFVNGQKLNPGTLAKLAFGDTIELLGLTLVVGKNLFSCNNPNNQISFNPDAGLVRYRAPKDLPQDPDYSYEAQPSFFYPALRFARSVEDADFQIEAPPQPAPEEEQSLAMRIGPSLIMGLCALLSATVFISMMAGSKNSGSGTSMIRAVPMVCMAVGMLLGSVLWPILNSRSTKKKRQAKENKRRSAYSQYVSKTLSEITKAEKLQEEILCENRIPVSECLLRAESLDDRLMDRGPMHKDYLELRIGRGTEPFRGKIRFPEDRFTIEDDDLRKAITVQANSPRQIEDVPLALPILAHNITGIVGSQKDVCGFARGLLIQIAALFSYENVKVVVLCNSKERDRWSFASHLPHCFSDDWSMRFFASNQEESNVIEMYLERMMSERNQDAKFQARDAKPYFIVFCTDEGISDKSSLIKTISGLSKDCGVALISLAGTMKDLPAECRWVIGLEENGGYILDRDVASGAKRPFTPDIFVSEKAADTFSRNFGRIRLDIKTQDAQIPDSLGFLEMLDIPDIEHLNIATQWRQSNSSASLACRVGVDAQGEPFVLNLHENAHGPHGLIAGTTGSGKSEFLITYILSMAVAYPPDEVSFVLIDYKGGGLAKAFDNDRYRLPHVAGVITNLDGAAITRSLASIQSELKRRQMLFNDARQVAGGENIDIYSYLNLYRQGRVREACPHLFIIADEFAELKQQEPEFMDELISAARIGRSLGVHLILATQKPSGVVNDQIWSNARFKVCLKVADANDSNEMIKRPDAASIKQAGRFYLLVGYNEYFALGQSAYSGGKYARHRTSDSKGDNAVTLISDTGAALISIAPKNDNQQASNKSELVTVLEELVRTSSSMGLKARQLWLSDLPPFIGLDSLQAKYAAEGALDGNCFIEPLIGEYDDPSSQRQGPVTLPLSAEGNALVYGTSDSGAESILLTLIYSLIEKHSPEDVNIYALDLGSESLRAFQKAPQVGDVIGMAEDEKISRFFAFLEREYLERRTVFAPYGGSYERYRDDFQGPASRRKPALVIILNDVGAFLETFPKLEDNLSQLVRESGRNGIYLVATTANSSSIRIRMRQAFRRVLACNLPSANEYSNIFGSIRGVPIPSGFARGLIALEEGIFEFQGAQIAEQADAYAFASSVSMWELQQAQEKRIPVAPAIPTAPDLLTPQDLLEMDGASSSAANATDAYRFAYGLYDDTLTPACFDFTETPLVRCLFQKKKDSGGFLSGLLQILSQKADVVLLDMAKVLTSFPEGCCSFSTNSLPEATDYLSSQVLAPEQPMDGNPDGNRHQIMVVSGITSILDGLGFEKANTLKDSIKKLEAGGNLSIILFDAAVDSTYTYEDWFKTHSTNKDGLWIGAGIESQTSMPINYNSSLLPDGKMNGRKGYESTGGTARLVHLVNGEGQEEQ